MSWNGVWNILNSNLVILFLGSGLGFLFVKVVWEPYKEREKKRQRQQIFRDEVAFRLFYIKENLETDSLLNPTIDGGSYAKYLDPEFQFWGLPGLVYSGWGAEALKKCLLCFDSLKLEEETRKNKSKLVNAENSLAEIKSTLGLVCAF
jgi:hypothetical protein